MQATSQIPATKPVSNIPVKSIALPIEHGAWGFLFEPLAAGLLLAPSLAAPFIILFTVGAFLTRQPLKFLATDMMKRRVLPRTPVARRFVLIFAAVTAVGFVGSLLLAPLDSFIPFLFAGPVALFLISQDVARQTRQLIPELLAAAALGSSITVLALAAGFGYSYSFALWAIMVARLIPSVLFVRNRLHLDKGKEYSAGIAIGSHVAALALVAGLFVSGLASLLTVGVAAFLLIRCITGLSSRRRLVPAKFIGIREVVYGVVYALSVVIGYYAGI